MTKIYIQWRPYSYSNNQQTNKEGTSEVSFSWLLLHHPQADFTLRLVLDHRNGLERDIEDICDDTSLLKDARRSDLHFLRLTNNIISVVKGVLLMVCELYTR